MSFFHGLFYLQKLDDLLGDVADDAASSLEMMSLEEQEELLESEKKGLLTCAFLSIFFCLFLPSLVFIVIEALAAHICSLLSKQLVCFCALYWSC